MFDIEDRDINVMEDTGLAFDFVYGSYVDWDRFRKDNREQLLAAAGSYLPFGEEISIDDFVEFISQDIFLTNNMLKYKVMGKLKLINVFGEESADKLKFKFIREDDELADEIINEFLDDYGVPSGTQYEEDLQEELKYWSYLNDDVYEIYRKYPIKLVDYEKNIKNIYELVKNESNTLVRKSLILASLIFTESMHKSVIIDKFLNEKFIACMSEEAVDKKANEILRSNIKYRNKWFARLYKKKSPYQYWNNLRNFLAHSIDDVNITEDMISYINPKNDNLKEIDIKTLRGDLLNFGSQIINVINNSEDD